MTYRTLRGKRQIRLYDFHRPEKLSREHQAALRILHDNMARFAATNLSAHVRSAVKVSLIALDQMTYEEFTERLGTPVVLGVAEFAPLEGKVGIDIRPEIAFPLIERLLGSPGGAETLRRPLTDLESAVMRTVFNRVIDSAEEAWRDVLEIEGSLTALETSPFFTQFAPPSEMMLVAGLLLEIGDSQGRINLAWPYIMLEAVLPQLSLQYWMGGSPAARHDSGETGGERSRIESHLMHVDIPLTVDLGTTTVAVRDLLELDVGDVLCLDQRVHEPLTVSVDGRRVFSGWPGRMGNNLAVQIQGATAEGGDNVEGDPVPRRD